MADVNHSTLSDPYLHEPKGVAAASAGEVYVADGAASGSWEPVQDIYTGVIADVSTAETVYIPIPIGGTVSKVTTVLEGAITAADATLTVKNSAAASMGTITVAFSASASGDVDSLSPASNNTVTADDYITIETDGGSSTAQRVWFSVVVNRNA